MAGSWGLVTGDWWHSRTVISSRARNLCHSRRGTYAFFTCAALFRFPHLSFLPPVPYPPLWGTFPSRGRLTIRGKPISADLRASLHIYSRRSRHHHFSFLISHFSFLIQARLPSPMKGQHTHGLTLPTSFTTKSCALHSSLFYFFPFLTTVFASGFASALPRPRLPVFASFFAVMYQAGDLSVHLFCFTVGSFGYCFL